MKFSVRLMSIVSWRAALAVAGLSGAVLLSTAALFAAEAPSVGTRTGAAQPAVARSTATHSGDALGPHDSTAPVNYEADRIELMDKIDRVALSGNVVITQGDLTMHSPRAIVAYTNNGSMQIQRLDATGGVTVLRGDETAHGDVATYDFNARLITMVGNVVVQRGKDDVQHSGRLVIDLNTHLTTTDAGPNGRVSGTFTVPKHDQKTQ
jgi:lipopolysaccharide export system protein LptA